MESIWNKYSDDRAAVIEDTFTIAMNRGQQEWSNADRDAMSQAVDDIVFSLGGEEGLTFVEFEVLVTHAARVDPRSQLGFLDSVSDTIRASRSPEAFSEYDERFLNFVVGIHNGLTVARGANLGLLVPPPLADANLAQHVLCQGPPPVNSMQFPSCDTTRTWKSEYEEVSGAGKYTSSVVETVTGDAFVSGGVYSTTSTTSSSFTPLCTPMLGIREASVDVRQSVEDFAELTPETGFGGF
ncbi:uncharacterized protein FFUJ_11514 [Fusarium fujikuroi IMI 58289]|uniref:Uncharacterized protein n=1 Tax=Gibberella fujikuroi (strain CBS 195.34 / IMI 58289 / NRRL A-6831) TaxID=1279085 RepID=S0EPP1_GIBF5|nr:uncharacterized protein FFUJ_11514 [Fusarium fujikuroi IMI 58289]CCT75490.1 uncharacterized protein FFUJ_11514 [Fusarium fujikuroi IMI 58289]SCO26054.1 uncharacterized protein FFM5_14434 [Fusarium fujikuroi]